MTTKIQKMNNTNIYTRIEHIIREFTGLDKDLVYLTHQSLGLSVMDHGELIMDIESEFDLHIPDSEAKDLRTFSDVADYVIKNIRMSYAIVSVDEKIRITSVARKGDYTMETIHNDCFEKAWKTRDGAENAMHRIWELISASKTLLKVVEVVPC